VCGSPELAPVLAGAHRQVTDSRQFEVLGAAHSPQSPLGRRPPMPVVEALLPSRSHDDATADPIQLGRLRQKVRGEFFAAL
jgi:hypothetical protein